MRETTLRSVAVPTEHGGWSITLEPAILGLIVAPSVAGLALAGAALLAFVARSPLRVVLVDRWRGRHTDRARLAARVLAVELVGLAGLIAVAAASAEAAFWWPIAAAVPLIGVELWHDMRSRSRRLIPELAGSVGIGAVAAAIALAGGEPSGQAFGLWLVIGARTIGAVPFIRLQLRRTKGQEHELWHSDIAQGTAVAVALAGAAAGIVPWPALAAVVVLAIFEFVAVRRPPQPAAVLGAQQVVLGLSLVLVTGLAVRAP